MAKALRCASITTLAKRTLADNCFQFEIIDGWPLSFNLFIKKSPVQVIDEGVLFLWILNIGNYLVRTVAELFNNDLNNLMVDHPFVSKNNLLSALVLLGLTGFSYYMTARPWLLSMAWCYYFERNWGILPCLILPYISLRFGTLLNWGITREPIMGQKFSCWRTVFSF